MIDLWVFYANEVGGHAPFYANEVGGHAPFYANEVVSSACLSLIGQFCLCLSLIGQLCLCLSLIGQLYLRSDWSEFKLQNLCALIGRAPFARHVSSRRRRRLDDSSKLTGR